MVLSLGQNRGDKKSKNLLVSKNNRKMWEMRVKNKILKLVQK